MKVLVTGGTGFVGGHITAAVQRSGHDVRLLARRPEQVPATLGPLGVQVDDVVAGDVLDEAAVDRALKGCDAVVHAAAIFAFDTRRGDEMQKTNARAAELVLGRAVAEGLDPVVHISSTVALTRFGGSGPDLPLGDITSPYCRSKIDSEVVARGLQDAEAPVACVYPGSVWGPHDPYLGVTSEYVLWILRGMFPLWPKSSIHAVDVRTVAATVVALLEPGNGPRRFVVPGVPLGARTLYRTLRQVTGRRLPYVAMPDALALSVCRATSALQRPLPRRWHYPADIEAVEVAVRETRFDDTPARTELGVQPLPLEQTLRDMTCWLVESGRLPAKYAGRALAARS